MSHSEKHKAFIKRIQQHKGLINKIIFLYADNQEDRKDLRQEILSEAWRSYASFKEASTFSTWLYRVGLNVALGRLRKKQPTWVSEATPERADNAHRLDQKELLEMILHVLQPIEKSIVLLMVEGYNQTEIAAILGISAENTRVKVYRIRKKLSSYGIKEFIRQT